MTPRDQRILLALYHAERLLTRTTNRDDSDEAGQELRTVGRRDMTDGEVLELVRYARGKGPEPGWFATLELGVIDQDVMLR